VKTKSRPSTPVDDVLQKGEPKRQGFLERLRNYFLTGIVVAAPIGITVYLITTVINFIDRRVLPLIPPRFQPETYLPFTVPGLGVLVVVIGLTLLGALTANFMGRTILRLGERVVNRLPLVRNLYGALKQLFETVVAQSSSSFQEVGLIEYPRRGIFCVVFVTTRSKGEVQERTPDDDLVSVFLPTTPNPTSGFLLFVPRRDIVILDMTIEEAAKMIVSAGLVAPEWPPPETEEDQPRRQRREVKTIQSSETKADHDA
jgi:uncharacterized membrane protein